MIPGEPPLPAPRGPLTAALFEYLLGRAPSIEGRPIRTGDAVADDDLQLALSCCYELHYRGFESVRTDREWDPEVLRFRAELEAVFTLALGEAVPVPHIDDSRDVAARIEAAIARSQGPSLSRYLLEDGTCEQFAELLIHRSAYQCKEADPHTWAIPRYAGRSRSALVELQADEYGNGVPGRAHAELFQTTMKSLGLDPTYGAYLNQLPGLTLATTNLVSMFGLHRRWLPALLGHLAFFEMTSVVPMQRYAQVVDRHRLGAAARDFYDVHVIADAHHGPLAAEHLVGGYLDDQPQDAATVLWGALTLQYVEERFARTLLADWAVDRYSLRAPGRPEDDPSRVERAAPRMRIVASAMHRWFSAREWLPSGVLGTLNRT